MKFSNNFIIYPASRALELAVGHYRELYPDLASGYALSGGNATLQDNVIHTQGNFELHRHDGALLEAATRALDSSLRETSRERSPLDWARIQNSLGNLLAALGQQRGDTDLYVSAIDAFNGALDVYSQEHTPQDWAWTLYNRGTAEHALGGAQRNAKLLKSAVDAYTRALLVWTRQETPLEWARTMHQLGSVLHSHGRLLKGNRMLQKSVVAYKNALTGLNEDDSGLELVATYNNRGAVLHNLGESEENPDRIEEAIRSYDAALDSSMALQLPIHLAVVCRINMAAARCAVARLRKDAAIAEQAAEELALIVECFRGACQPRFLEHCEDLLSGARAMTETFGREEAGAG